MMTNEKPQEAGISLETGLDLRTPAGQTAAWNKSRQEEPHLVVVMAFPGSPWSTLQNMQQDKQAVIEKRAQDFLFLEFAAKVAGWQEGRGRLCL